MDFLIDFRGIADRPGNLFAQDGGVLLAQTGNKFLHRSQTNPEHFCNLLVRKCRLAVDGVYKRFQRLEVENAPINQAARIYQVTRNDAPNQQWFIKRTKFSKNMGIPAAILRDAHRHWPSFLWYPLPGYSLIAAHSGLCLDILNAPTENGDALQQSPVSGRRSHLWAFASDQQGYNFIVNLCSGRVLDVFDNSLKNYATVQQSHFNGTDSQRWQLFA
jgi:hypothetical protein